MPQPGPRISLWLHDIYPQLGWGAPGSQAWLSCLRTFAKALPLLRVLLAQHSHSCLDSIPNFLRDILPFPPHLLPAYSPAPYPLEHYHYFRLCACCWILLDWDVSSMKDGILSYFHLHPLAYNNSIWHVVGSMQIFKWINKFMYVFVNDEKLVFFLTFWWFIETFSIEQ